MSASFEDSYLGAAGKISKAALMECKICWTPYDPADGDETRQIEPGTAFVDLPVDWTCPTCDGAKDQFMVLEDQGTPGLVFAPMTDKVRALVGEFQEIHHGKMRGTPFCNQSLHVEAVGFRPWNGNYLGVLVTPWFMNLAIMPGPEVDWSGLATGAKELIDFPSGPYEFIHAVRPAFGGYKVCSLFSPMAEFPSQLQATDVARAVLVVLFQSELPEPGEPAEASRATQATPVRPSRRTLLTGRLATDRLPQPVS